MLRENFNKVIGTMKKNQLEVKNTITEMKTTLESINSILYEKED